MRKFEVGKKYFTRSIGDHDCIITVEVLSRTAKTIKARTSQGDQTFRISEYEGVEQVRPWGSYSMCPIVGADRQSMIYATALDQAEADADRCGRSYVYRHRSKRLGYYVSPFPPSGINATLCVTVVRDNQGIIFTGAAAADAAWEES
jgi:hypothetical protein